jgi:DNA end-binding protein Ku
MPSIWSGVLTFGLVAIPVSLESAVRSHKVSFRQIHREDQGRVKYRKVCEVDEHPLEQHDIGRAYEAPGGQLVPLDDRELDDMPLPTAKTIEISGFVDLESVPPEYFDQPYYLAPQNPAANKPYVLMRDALARSGKAAVGKYALRGSGENLGLIHARGDVLVLERIHWPDEIRSAADAVPRGEVDVSEEELAAAGDYIRAAGDIDMQAMRDEYAGAVQQLLEAKAKHRKPPRPAAPEPADAEVTDLMSALQRAAEQARAERGEDAEVHQMGGKKTAAKKTTKKAPAKKAAAKKASRKRAG